MRVSARKSPSNKQSKSKSKRGVSTYAPRKLSGLDAGATAWAKLLADPCNAPLAHSIFPGTAGAQIARFESDTLVFNSATDVGGLVAFVPGTATVLVNTVGVTGDTSGTTLSQNIAMMPGYSFLSANAASVRCVGACMQIMYAGTELNRQGVIGTGVGSATWLIRNIATADGGGNVGTSTSQVRQLCQNTCRTPTDMCEVIWRPGTGDGRFSEQIFREDINAFEFRTASMADKNAIWASIAGIPVSTGVRVRIVAVYEYTPANNTSMVSSVETPISRNSVNDVLIALDNMLPNWFFDGYKKVKPWVNMVSTIAGKVAKIGSFLI